MCPVCFANRWPSHGKSQYTQHLPKPPCRHGGFWSLDQISPIFSLVLWNPISLGIITPTDSFFGGVETTNQFLLLKFSDSDLLSVRSAENVATWSHVMSLSDDTRAIWDHRDGGQHHWLLHRPPVMPRAKIPMKCVKNSDFVGLCWVLWVCAPVGTYSTSFPSWFVGGVVPLAYVPLKERLRLT